MALPITPSLVEDAAAGLAGDGWRYTQRQLYYATCARAETPRSNAAANGEIGFGVLLLLIGLILIGIKVLFALFVTLGVALILAGILARSRKPPVRTRLLALSFDEFRSGFGALQLPGLIDSDAGRAGAAATTPDTIVICDTDETALMVAANLERAQVAGAVLATAQASITPQPGANVVALHDASPRGCAMVLDLRDAGVAVEDAGLHPADVDSPDHQVIEGAPARLPRDLSALLRTDEVDWLLSGRRVELATLSPEQAMSHVVAAISRLHPLRGDAPQPAR